MRTPAIRFQFPGRRRTLGLVGTALALSLIAWYFGVDVSHAILLGVAATVIGIVVLGAPTDQPDGVVDWQLPSWAGRSGTRDEVVSLASSMRVGWFRTGRTAEVALRQTAVRRLALEGLDLNDPEHQAAIEARIGRGAYRILTRSDLNGLSLKTLVACMDILDSLDPAAYPPPRQPVSSSPRRRPSPRKETHE